MALDLMEIIIISSIIISGLVPLLRRGNYAAIVVAIFGAGSTLGPFIAGAIISSTTWRWVFYLNLPIGGVAFGILFMFIARQLRQRSRYMVNGLSDITLTLCAKISDDELLWYMKKTAYIE